MARAEFLDSYLAQHGKPIGPLHGLPISVKEHFAMEGLGVNAGFVAWHDRIEKEDAHVLKLLWNAGAVFYVRSTEPQLLMHLESASNLYGVTVNPFNRELTSGGSSGGEGALLGLRGSCLGIGTDIGGSVRSPAANCGVWSLRPSTYRVPTGGAIAIPVGEEQIVFVVGPMSTSFEGLNLFMKAVIDQQPWLREPSLIPLPWSYPPAQSSFTNPMGHKRRLNVGVLYDDDFVRPHPPVSRAMHQVVARLGQLDSEFSVTVWKPYKHDVAWDLISSLYYADGAKQVKDVLARAGEPLLPLSKFITEQPNVREYSISEVWDLTAKREAYRAEYSSHWNSITNAEGEPVDVILCPVGPGAAPPLEHSRYWNYTSTWNLLDYPAIVFPVTSVGEALDQATGEDEDYKPRNEQDAWNWKLWTQRGAKGYKDAPVSLQLVGRRWQDEKLFEGMALIKDACGL